MPFLCRDHDLGSYPEFMNPINDARHVAKFCGAELARCEDKLKTLSEFGMTAWIDDDFGAFFLDVPLTATKMEEYKQIELVVAKMFIDGILWCVVYHAGKFLITLSDAKGEHELLNTKFPIISNPHKEFPIEKYTNPNAPYRGLTLMYSPMNGSAGEKTADIIDVSSGEDNELEDQMEYDEDEMYAGDKNGPVFREGYHQTYIVRKPRGRTTRRSVFVRCGNWCYDGEVDLGQLSLALSDVPMAIPILQAQQGSLRYVSEFSRLSRSSPYRRPLIHLVRVAGFIEEQVATAACEEALMQLESLSSGSSPQKPANPHGSRSKGGSSNVNDKMEAGEAPEEYFELELTEACKVYKNVELLASKTYVRGIILILVYFDGQFYCTMGEGQGDQPLLDVAFPDMSRRGGGCMIGTFSHPYFRKFSVWQGTTTDSSSGSSPQGKLKNGSSPGARGRQQQRKPRGMASKMADANDDARSRGNGDGESDPVDELGTEGQTYIIFQHPSGTQDTNNDDSSGATDENNGSGSSMSESTRPAFFRFGGFCYGGNVVVNHGPNEMTLSALSDVLPSLGEQQRSMSFSTELERLPTTSRQYNALLRLQRASEYLLEQLEAAEVELDKLREFLETRGQSAWVDDESRQVYFELQLTSEGNEPLQCVEVAASKIHVNGVLLSTMYFGGTLYATVSSGSDGEHALLDSSFPDVTTKGRGYTIGATPHSYYKKFAVWEGNADGTLVGSASSPKSASRRSGPALSDSSGSPLSAGSKTSEKGGSGFGNDVSELVKEGKDADASERAAASFGGKTGEGGTGGGSGSGSGGGGGGGRKPSIGPVKTAGRRLAPIRKEIGPGGFGAKPPSKLAPLGESFANRGNFSGLQPLKKIGANAPWDAMGRPKLGSIGSGSSSNNKK